MNFALPLDFVTMDQKKQEKVITFSSSSMQAIVNIPNKMLGIIIWPFYICFFIPLITFMLWRLQKTTAKQHKKLEAIINDLSYENAKESYISFVSLLKHIELSNKQLLEAKNDFFLRGMYNQAVRIEQIVRKSEKLLASTLFVTLDPSEITTEDKKTLEDLNEYWGNDNNEVYARALHYHLTHGQQKV